MSADQRPEIVVDRLQPGDREAWERLFRAYIDFYETSLPDEAYERAWRELAAGEWMHARCARRDRELVAIAHFLVHPNTWGADVCYLQDLFTAPEARGLGAASALIEAAAEWAREQGCGRLYWSTHVTNDRARRVYDRLAVHRGFIRYELAL